MAGCNSGSSSTPVSSNPYNLQNYTFTGTDTGGACTIQSNSTLSCNSKGQFAGNYTVSFSTLTGAPGAYVLMPPTGNLYGLNIGGIACNQTASTPGNTYSCNFGISASNPVAGNTVYIQITGSLGAVNIIAIQLN